MSRTMEIQYLVAGDKGIRKTDGTYSPAVDGKPPEGYRLFGDRMEAAMECKKPGNEDNKLIVVRVIGNVAKIIRVENP